MWDSQVPLNAVWDSQVMLCVGLLWGHRSVSCVGLVVSLCVEWSVSLSALCQMSVPLFVLYGPVVPLSALCGTIGCALLDLCHSSTDG